MKAVAELRAILQELQVEVRKTDDNLAYKAGYQHVTDMVIRWCDRQLDDGQKIPKGLS